MATPFIRWPGGKRLLVPFLLPLIEAALIARPGARYVEPFLGAGAVALAVDGAPKVLNDACVPLVNAWRWVRDQPDQRHTQAMLLLADRSRDAYLEARTRVCPEVASL